MKLTAEVFVLKANNNGFDRSTCLQSLVDHYSQHPSSSPVPGGVTSFSDHQEAMYWIDVHGERNLNYVILNVLKKD